MFVTYDVRTAKKAARTLEKYLRSLGLELKHGQALDALARLQGYGDWNAVAARFAPSAVDAELDEHERVHAADTTDVNYGDEVLLHGPTGFALRAPAYPAEVDYVRVTDPLGREIAYWSSDEWREAPEEVMGALLGAVLRGHSDTATAVAPETQARAVPSIGDVPWDRVIAVLIDEAPYQVQWRHETALLSLRTGRAPQADDLDDDPVALECYYVEDGVVEEQSLRLSELRGLRWDSTAVCFRSATGKAYVFYLEQRFGAMRSA